MPPQVHTFHPQQQHEEDEQQPQSQNERRDNESSSAATEELRRQVLNMRIEMHRQAACHQMERLQWEEERQSLTSRLRQQPTSDRTTNSPGAISQNSQLHSLLIDGNEEICDTTGRQYEKSPEKSTFSTTRQANHPTANVESTYQTLKNCEKRAEHQRCEREIFQIYVESHEKLHACKTEGDKQQIYSQSDPDEKSTSVHATEATMQNPEASGLIRNHAAPAASSSSSDIDIERKIRRWNAKINQLLQEVLKYQQETESLIRQHFDSLRQAQTTSRGSPQPMKILPSQSKTTLEIAGKADGNLLRQAIIPTLLPVNVDPTSREERLLKRIMDRRPFGENGDTTNGNRKRRITPTLLSKNRVFKVAPITTEESFSREATTFPLAQQRTVNQLPHCPLEKTPEERVSKQLGPSISGVIQALGASQNRAESNIMKHCQTVDASLYKKMQESSKQLQDELQKLQQSLQTSQPALGPYTVSGISESISKAKQGQIAKNKSCKGMDVLPQTLSPEGETNLTQDGNNSIGSKSGIDRLNYLYERLLELEKQKKSQQFPSRGQAKPIWRVAANNPTYESNPESGCKIKVSNNAAEEPITLTNFQTDNSNMNNGSIDGNLKCLRHTAVAFDRLKDEQEYYKAKLQELNRRMTEEEKLQKMDYENAKELVDMTPNYQANVQSFDNNSAYLGNVQYRAGGIPIGFENAKSYSDAKVQFYHNGTDRPIRMPTSRGQYISCHQEADYQEKSSSEPIVDRYDLG